jgi:hypothetical protein
VIAELRAELPWTPHEAVEVVPGVDFIGGTWQFEFESPFGWTDVDDPLTEREAIALDGYGNAAGPDFYLKTNLRPLADRERLLVTPGIRSNWVTFTYRGSITGEADESTHPYTIIAWDPRIAGRFRIVENSTVKASTGIYHQPPQPHESVGIGTDVATGYERSWASSIGFEQQVGPAFQGDIELFWKDMDQLIVFNEAWTGFGSVVFLNQGEGRAYGAELILRHARTGRFFGWLSYTLSKSERCDEDCASPDAEWYAFDFDQPHIFSAQGGYDLPLDFSISAQTQYVSGNPDTPYDAGVYDVDGDFYNPFAIGEYHEQRLPPYFQTSVRLDKLWTFKKWQLDTYVDLMNVVRGVNPEFTVYNFDYTEYAYVRGLPFIPNVGIEAKVFP